MKNTWFLMTKIGKLNHTRFFGTFKSGSRRSKMSWNWIRSAHAEFGSRFRLCKDYNKNWSLIMSSVTFLDYLIELNCNKLLCPNFGQPALSSSFTKYRFLLAKNNSAMIVNRLSVLQLFQLSNGDKIFPSTVFSRCVNLELQS